MVRTAPRAAGRVADRQVQLVDNLAPLRVNADHLTDTAQVGTGSEGLPGDTDHLTDTAQVGTESEGPPGDTDHLTDTAQVGTEALSQRVRRGIQTT